MVKLLLTFSDSVEANLVLGRLRNAGIECFLTNVKITTLMPHYSSIIGGGIRLMVNENDYERAYKIIYQAEAENNPKNKTCPYCNSKRIKFSFGKKSMGTFFSILLSLFMAAPMGNLKRKYICRDCGGEF